MTEKNLKTIIINELDELQAFELNTLDISKMSTIADFMIVCSGRSKRHVVSIAKNLVDKLKLDDIRPASVSGLESGEWVLVDYGDYLVHIMQPTTRAFYNIESLWELRPDESDSISSA